MKVHAIDFEAAWRAGAGGLVAGDVIARLRRGEHIYARMDYPVPAMEAVSVRLVKNPFRPLNPDGSDWRPGEVADCYSPAPGEIVAASGGWCGQPHTLLLPVGADSCCWPLEHYCPGGLAP
jgi:hypothetical protein